MTDPILGNIIIGIAGVLALFVLTKIDRNQTNLFKRTDEHDKRITVIETRCDDTHGQRRKTDKGGRGQ